MTAKWHQAVAASRARNGYAIGVGVRPPLHVVTVTPRPQLDGTLLYAAECSCRNWLCTDAATDAEARQRAKDACGVGVRFTSRSEMPFEIVRHPRSV